MKTGDLVIYHSGGGAAVGGLIDGGIYHVGVVSPTALRLAESLGDIAAESYLCLDPSAAAGDGHRLGVLESGAVKTASEVIEGNAVSLGFSHGLVTGQEVVYHSGGGTSIGGLTDGASYFVVVVDPTTFKLATDPADIFFGSPDVLIPGACDSGICRFVPVENPTGALGDVELISRGSILPEDDTSLVRGGVVDMTSGGAIGAMDRILRIDTATSSESGLSALAAGDVVIEEISGHLNVISARSLGGDVRVSVADGMMRDSNREENRDVRTIEELLRLWDDMNLLGDAAEQSARDTVDAYVNSREREYHTYWRWRSRQEDPSVFDPNFSIGLSAVEKENYREQLGWDDIALALFEARRTDEYRALHEIYGVLGDVYDPDWTYDAGREVFEPSFDPATAAAGTDGIIVLGAHIFSTGQGVVYRTDGDTPVEGLEDGATYFVVRVDSTRIRLALSQADAMADTPVVIQLDGSGTSGLHRLSDLEALTQGSAWSLEQLSYSVGGGWLKETADTTTRIESPNVQAGCVTLTASEGIGTDLEPIVIDLSQGKLNLTDDQKVALATAERKDLTVIDADRDTFTFGSVHGLKTGDGVLFPGPWRLDDVGGVIESHTYYAVTIDSFTLQLAGSVEDALAGTGIVDLTRSEARIASHEDLDVAASGAIDVSSGAHVYLGSEAAMELLRVEAGGSIIIKGGGAITSGAPTGETAIIGADLILEAAGGSMGTPGTPVVLSLTAGSRLTARAEESVYLAVHGDLLVDTLFARQDACLVATGGILDAYLTDLTSIRTGNLRLEAGDDIGAAGNALEVDLDPGGRMTLDAGGAVFVREVFGDVLLDGVSAADPSQSGDTGGSIIIMTGNGSITVSGCVSIEGDGNLLFAAGGSRGSVIIDGEVNVRNGNVSISAAVDVTQSGDIVTNGGSVFVQAHRGSIVMKVGGETSTNGGSVYYDAGVDVVVCRMDAFVGNVSIRASEGSILDACGNTDDADICGYALRLEAGDGIGAGDALETEVVIVAARAGTGLIHLSEIGSLIIDAAATVDSPIRVYEVGTDGTATLIPQDPVTGVSTGGGAVTVESLDGTIVVAEPVIVEGDGNIIIQARGGRVTLNAQVSTRGGVTAVIESNTVTFEWQEITGALAYLLQTTEGGSTFDTLWVQDGTEWTSPYTFPEGDYSITTRAWLAGRLRSLLRAVVILHRFEPGTGRPGEPRGR